MVVEGHVGGAHACAQPLGTWPDQKLAPGQKRPYTLGLGMRSWLFAAFRDLKRPDAAPPPGA